MSNLIFSILLFNILIIIFKMFQKYKVNNLHALIFNYLVACFCSYLFIEDEISLEYIINAEWIFHAISIGILFFITFMLYSYGVQKVGISIATISNKMSLIIPVTTAIILYNEELNPFKGMAFLLALYSIYLSSNKEGKLSFDKRYAWLVFFIFLGQGISDSIFNDFAQNFDYEKKYLFFMVLFFIASISGFIINNVKKLQKNNFLKIRNLLWGVALGIPNFFCLVFFLKALETSNFNSSTVFSIVSIGIVITSALLGLFLFKEKLSRKNWIGVLTSILTIYILSY